MISNVTIRNCKEYDPSAVQATICRVLDDLGGPQRFFSRGDRVLLKPNLLRASDPQAAVVTHPMIVEAVATIVIENGGRPYVGDSPPMGNLKKVLQKSGYEPFMKKLGVPIATFSKARSVEFNDGYLFRRIDIADEIFHFDAVINLPKLKTHCQMLLTLAAKNLFGTIIGTEKASWHLRAGRDTDTFAKVLLQILETIKPCLHILDGILGMEGDGPNSGKARPIGIVAASSDPIALDATICRLLGFSVDRLRTCALGAQMSLGNIDPSFIEVLGDTPEGFPLRDFKSPKSMSLHWNLSKSNPIRRLLEKYLVTRPFIDSDACVRCEICAKHCPPQAIRKKGERLFIDVGSCISCFCCHEMCTNNAVKINVPILGRVLNRLGKND
jgi:uncharacterized protein (DUF362 family)/Pyruvate/2-oxoacid:ferredoxin oxidoreductase delta subunit